jgi:putative transposase
MEEIIEGRLTNSPGYVGDGAGKVNTREHVKIGRWNHERELIEVTRTFGWLMYHRLLVRDYERTISSAEAWVYIAMIRIQLRRLA